MKRFIWAFLLSLVVLALWTIPVLAIGNPDYVTIGDVYVFRNVSETGDQLYFCRYDVSYNTVPDEDPEDTWQMALYNSTGSLIATRPLNYYQHNIISIYLTPAQALTWGGSHQVIIQGMPSVFGNLTEGINQRTRTLSPGDYYEKEYLAGIMITQAEILETDWAITLLTANDKLNSTGKTFFLLAIPGLGSMAPEIFEVTTADVDVDYVEYNQTYTESLRTNAGDRIDYIIDELGGLMRVSDDWMAFWLISVGFLVFVGVIFAGVGNPGWAFAGGFPFWVGAAFIMGGPIFTTAAVVVVVAAIVFAVYFILSRFA